MNKKRLFRFDWSIFSPWARLMARDEEIRGLQWQAVALQQDKDDLYTENQGLRAENERLRAVLTQINAWCWTDDGAHALPTEPPWAKAMHEALSQ